MENEMNQVMEMLNQEGIAPAAEPVQIEVSTREPKLTKGEKIAVGACIGGAALAVVEAGVILVLVKRNGGLRQAFRKKDVDEDDFDDFESYEEFEDDDEEEEVVENKEEKKENK